MGFPTFNSGDNALRRAQSIKEDRFRDDPVGFLNLVQAALYEGVSIDLEYLTTNPLLSAIGSLVMSSRRGSASKVITLNFDDVLETYLEYFGFVVAAVANEKYWEPNSNVVIYHPHGFLPLSPERQRSGKIVLSSRDFFQAIATTPTNAWRLLLLTLLRTHTVLHIGLSGEDLNVESLMDSVEPLHAASPTEGTYAGEVAYNGVRFSLAKDADEQRDLIQTYKGYRVFTHFLPTWDRLPSFLFKVCQNARALRTRLDAI